MSTSSLFPFAGDHAIQNVVFTIEWATPLSQEALLKFRSLHNDLRSSFPSVNDMRSWTINFGINPTGQPIQGASNEIGGIQFLGMPMGLGGHARMLHVTPMNCVAIINDYTRWERVWADVQKWFSIVVPNLFDSRQPISVIGLQYTDIFHWRDNPEKLNLAEIFSTDTDYLPKNAFKQSSLWHSHHGYFEEREDPLKHKLLNNINVGMIENQGQRAISILTVHKATLSAPAWEATDLQSAMNLLLPNLHVKNKQILGSLLSAEVCSKIKLIV